MSWGLKLPSLKPPKIKLPKPADLFVPPKPPIPPFAPPIVKSTANTVHAFLSAPIKSTIAADPLLAWAQTGKWQNHGDRTKAGVHELYKEDRIAQALGVREQDVVTVVNIVAVVVVVYFGGAFLGAWGGSGTAAAGAGAASTGTGLTAAGVTEGLTAAGAVAKLVKPKPKVIGGEMVQASAPTEAELLNPEKTSGGGLTLAGSLLGLAAFFIF